MITRRVVRLPLSRSSVRGHASVIPRVAALAERYPAARQAVQASSEPDFLLQLPGEPRPTTRHMEGWLDSLLADLRVR